jgi:hypothetical protein
MVMVWGGIGQTAYPAQQISQTLRPSQSETTGRRRDQEKDKGKGKEAGGGEVGEAKAKGCSCRYPIDETWGSGFDSPETRNPHRAGMTGEGFGNQKEVTNESSLYHKRIVLSMRLGVMSHRDPRGVT